MGFYDEDYLSEVEKEIDEIRNEALKAVQRTHPEIKAVTDRRTVYDYCERVWDYPGKWYMYFKLPSGFKRKEELILAIARDTIDYFTEKR